MVIMMKEMGYGLNGSATIAGIHIEDIKDIFTSLGCD